MSNQEYSFLEILFEAYEQGENEQEITVERLVQDLSMKLQTMLMSSKRS